MAAGHQKLKRFADYADGSLLELETQLTLAKRLNFLHVEEAVRLFRMTRETGQLLNGLRRSLIAESRGKRNPSGSR